MYVCNVFTKREENKEKVIYNYIASILFMQKMKFNTG